MLKALEAVEHVGELARLFFILAQQGKLRMEEQAMIEACKRTAGLSTRYPRPIPAIAIAVAAGLLNRVRGVLVITDRGGVFASQGTPNSVDLTRRQAKFLLGAILDGDSVERAMASLLSNFQIVRGQLIARKNSLQSSNIQLLLCRLLQQLGAVAVVGDYYVVARPFDDLLAHLVIRTAKLTQSELLQKLERQRRRGELAELKALELEKERLKILKRPDLASKIEHVSVQDVSAGYDIKSFEKDERPRLIEVKSSVGSQIVFQWSIGERTKAEREADSYFIYFIRFSFSLPELIEPLVVIQNPVAKIEAGHFLETASNYTVVQAEYFTDVDCLRFSGH